VPGALAGVEAGEHRRGGVQAGEHVGDGHADLAGRPLGGAGDTHQPAQCLDGEVVAGEVAQRAGAAEAGDATDDEGRVDGEELVGGEAEAGGGVGEEVLEQDVGPGDEVVKEGAPFGPGEVQGEAALVAVAGEVVSAGAVGKERRAPGAGLVAGAGALELEDVGAEVAEHLPAERPGEDAGGVEDAHPGERPAFRPVLLHAVPR
jgi:hypothetical protein